MDTYLASAVSTQFVGGFLVVVVVVDGSRDLTRRTTCNQEEGRSAKGGEKYG